MYRNSNSVIRINNTLGDKFGIKVTVLKKLYPKGKIHIQKIHIIILLSYYILYISSPQKTG